MARPFLEEILVTGSREWHRIVIFPTANRANFVIARLRSAYSKAEWEWRGAKLLEVGQSAIYVRYIGPPPSKEQT